MATRREAKLEALLSEHPEAIRPEAPEVPLPGILGGPDGPDGLEAPPDFETKVKPPKPESKSSERPRARTKDERLAEDVANNLMEKSGTIFGLIHGIAPATAAYGAENSEKAFSALVAVGKRHPKFMAGLARVADGADALEIGKFVLGLLVCIQVDTQRLRGDELPARLFGVTEVLETYGLYGFGEEQGPMGPVNHSVINFSEPPPTFRSA